MSGCWRTYFQLLRFPAVFTLIADVMMAFLVARGDLKPVGVFVAAILASASLYLGGMVLNDVFDADVDAQQRPERPIPSGRITRNTASKLGWGLMLVGVTLFTLAGYFAGSPKVGALSLVLAGVIWIYDAVAKGTVLAPLMMGLCRAINVALVMAIAAHSLAPADTFQATAAERLVILAIALYIAGITWFARSEASSSSRWQLVPGMITMLLGLVLYASSPLADHSRETLESISRISWELLWLAIAAVVLRRCALALADPQSRVVQVAVRSALRSLIVIDAALVLGFCGAAWGWAVLALLLPMLLLERWASTT